MARLAEYLREVAAILGEPASVHFVGLESGSTIPLVAVDHEAWPKVHLRLERAEGPDAAPEQQAAVRRINTMLREDNADGDLQGPTGNGRLLYFPGRFAETPKPIVVKESGSIQGIVCRVGGTDQSVPVHLVVEGEELKGCHASRSVAKGLAGHLFEPVRLYGTGVWRREEDGAWRLTRFEVRDFEVLHETSLGTAFAELRQQGIRFQEVGGEAQEPVSW